MRFFNTAGPVNCDKHYCLPPLSRFNEGIAQARSYADRCGADDVHLVVLDRTSGKTWSKKIFRKKEVSKTPEGDEQAISIWGM
jgi:hypothetical protein